MIRTPHTPWAHWHVWACIYFNDSVCFMCLCSLSVCVCGCVWGVPQCVCNVCHMWPCYCIDGCRMLSSEESSALTSSLNIRHVEPDSTTAHTNTNPFLESVNQSISHYLGKLFSCGDIYEHLAGALIQREQSIIWLHSAVMEIESLLHNRKWTYCDDLLRFSLVLILAIFWV